MAHSTSMIYLASASPRRHELLLQMGMPHEILAVPAPPGDDEPQLANELPEAYVRRTAKEKAIRAVEWIAGQKRPLRPILSADTTVILDGTILGKPADISEARQMLQCLSGRKHHVHTAIVLAAQNRFYTDVSVTEVQVKTLTSIEIDAYCATGEPFGKAGGYGIQGVAGVFIEHISGSYSGVMGLPIYETHRLLQAAGVIA